MLACIVAAELVGASEGIGFMIWSASQSFETPVVVLGICLLACIGIAGERLLWILQIKTTPWVGHG